MQCLTACLPPNLPAVFPPRLSQDTSPDLPSPTTACKDKLHRSFRLAKLQVNRDLEAYLGEARAAAAAASTSAATGGDTSPGALTSVDRIILIAERCLGEGVASFRESIQAIVDQVEVGREG